MKTHLGHYEIESEIGRGGMGVVYRAFEPALNRHVAIKELSPSLAHDPQLVERFLREARSMAALSDPHIIQIFYIGTDEATSQPFFAMEFVEGESLSAILKRDGKIGVENTLRILHQTAQGLATAHDRGVIHRDIKPGNLMLSDRGQVKIADFGIALATKDVSKKLTTTGEFVGTPGYLSPEVCLGKPIDQRSDIFSLGIVMFEMLSGRTPFSDESPLGLMLEVVKAEIPNIQELNGEVDPQTAAILARMVAKEPEQRFQSCHDLAAALEAHPLMARGGTVKLARPALVPDAATVIGTPAPRSTARKVTPPPVVRSGATPAQPAPAMPERATAPSAQARPSVLERPVPQRSSAWIPLAIAAVLVLSVAGGAFAFRGQIVDFVRGFGDGFAGRTEGAYDAGRSTGKASNPIGASLAADAASTPSGAAMATTSAAAAAAADPEAVSQAVLQDQAPAASTQIAVEAVPAAAVPVPVAAADPAGNVSAAAPASAPSLSPGEGAALAAVAPAVAPAVVPATAKAQTVASAAPRPVTPPTPQRVAVIALGDSAISGPARSRIENQLAAAGFDLVDAEALGVGGGDLASALNALRRSATVAVVVRAEPVGSQQLSYYGRTSELYTATLTVRAYRTSDRSSIGGGLSEKVQFTTLNADSQAQSALSGKLDGLISSLAPYRKRG
ncbi:MAG: protein kinase [Xanthomonadaceae bacterium]|nr:protein kinase [Xanthomonadaceae bacterium]